jgi:polysaccharide biosynthesis protein PslH
LASLGWAMGQDRSWPVDERAALKILFLSRWFPYPPDNGSKKRCFNLVKILASKYEVDLISFASEPIPAERLKGLEPYCQSVQTVQYKDYNPQSFRARLGYLSTWPRFIYDTYRKEFRKTVQEACRKTGYDLVTASQVDMTPYTKGVRGAKVLIDEIELAFYQEDRKKQTDFLRRMRTNLTWWKHARYVNSIIQRVDGVSVVSENEKIILSQLNHSDCRVQVIPNGIEMDFYQGDWGEPEADTLIYAGALSYFANLDAMQYFIAEILPIIKKSRPAVKLFITGRFTETLRSKLPIDPNVEFTGYLEDVRPHIGRAWMSVIPLRIGGGTRLKILEALAMGTPVVSTSKGAEGLELETGRDILIRDSPEAFAAGVVEILGNRELRDRLGTNGQLTTGSLYDWNLIGGRFLDFVDDIVKSR